MSTPPVHSPELRRLTDKLLDEGKLVASESARLTEILREPEALDWFLTVVQQDSLLEEIIPGYVAAAAAERGRIVAFSRRQMFCRVAGIAAIFIVGVSAGALLLRKGFPVPGFAFGGRTPARVTALMGVRWAPDADADELLDGGLAPKHLALEAGLAEITYGNGVRVTIEGPCDYSIVNASAGRLDFGKLVAHVPHGAEGFRVDYARGKIVDLGTEFAMDLNRDGVGEIGVFEGKVEVHHGDRKMLPLFANQAVQASSGSGETSLEAVPLNREKFIRQVPTRDFRWEVAPQSTLKFSADVSHLVWKASDYRILFKCFRGTSLKVRGVRLLLDDREVAVDSVEGGLGVKRGSLRELRVPEDAFARGRWTVEAEIVAGAAEKPGESALGIMQLEEGLVKQAVAADFIGSWQYSYFGSKNVRVISPDGSVKLILNGAPNKGYKPGRWEVVDGILTTYDGAGQEPETHVLRDKDTLIFTNRPYENAKRADASGKK